MDTQNAKSIEHVWPFLKVEEMIGQGSSGEVYRVRREGMGRTYYSAVKVIRIPKGEAEIREMRNDGMDEQSIHNYFQGLVEQLSAEIDLMESLKSAPNIVCIQDFSVRKHKIKPSWIAHIRMELLESLNNYRERRGMSEDDVLRLGIDLCTALEYCDRVNVIHRDIKPANIFVTEFGDFKLGDFSVSRKTWMTSVRSTKGTYAYMAPEVARGLSYDKTIDLYSLGLVMYRLLNENRLPFLPDPPAPIQYEDNQTALSRRLAGESITRPMYGSRELCDVVLKACAFRPEDRFSSASQMREALLECRDKTERTERIEKKLHFSDDTAVENPYRLSTGSGPEDPVQRRGGTILETSLRKSSGPLSEAPILPGIRKGSAVKKKDPHASEGGRKEKDDWSESTFRPAGDLI